MFKGEMNGRTPSHLPQKVRRLIFRVERGQIRLESDKQIEMSIPPSDRRQGNVSGLFHIDILDRHGTVLFAKHMSSPLKNAVEVRTGNPDNPLAHESIKPEARRETFVIHLPVFENATELVMFEASRGDLKETKATTDQPIGPKEVFRMPLNRKASEEKR